MNAAAAGRPILLVEDNGADAELLLRAFQRNAPHVKVQHVNSGDEALDYIMGLKQYADRTIYGAPGLILLDLQLPDLKGIQILNVIRHTKGLARVPVVVLSGSFHEDAVAKAYEAGASSFVVKQADSNRTAKLVKAIATYWLEFNQVPEALRQSTASSE